MQTFLPFPSFVQSARALDYRRLGKQRVETQQVCLALSGQTYGWRNHPAAKMWQGYESALVLYGLVMCLEWRARGYQDILAAWFWDRLSQTAAPLPPWVGDPEFHQSHQSNLVRKDPIYYGKLFPEVPASLPYVWPTPAKLAA